MQGHEAPEGTEEAGATASSCPAAEADALANSDYSGFSEHLRVPVRFAELRLEVVEKFATHYRDMMLQREKRKLELPRVRVHPPRFKKNAKKTLSVW